jgi:hypothetical protein
LILFGEELLLRQNLRIAATAKAAASAAGPGHRRVGESQKVLLVAPTSLGFEMRFDFAQRRRQNDLAF